MVKMWEIILLVNNNNQNMHQPHVTQNFDNFTFIAQEQIMYNNCEGSYSTVNFNIDFGATEN